MNKYLNLFLTTATAITMMSAVATAAPGRVEATPPVEPIAAQAEKILGTVLRLAAPGTMQIITDAEYETIDDCWTDALAFNTLSRAESRAEVFVCWPYPSL